MKNTVLVIPTIREESFKQFIKRWDDVNLFEHLDLIVVEDNAVKTFEIPDSIRGMTKISHIAWDDIDAMFGSRSWIIPRRSDTVRSVGYWLAWKQGYEFILTLDDDCYPCVPDEDGLSYDGATFVNEHKKYLTQRTRWHNTLNSVKPRGIPFYRRGQLDTTIVNHGLWTKVLDYDAPYQLANPIKEKFSYDNNIVPHGMYFPMCGMNVMWKREATVLMYHLLMGQRIPTLTASSPKVLSSAPYVTEKLAFDRFGDIWCGIFMKKIADLSGFTVSTGMPYIRHERASNPFTNLKKEANGIEVNEELWEHVDSFRLSPGVKLNEAYHALGTHVGKFERYKEHVEYFRTLGNAMTLWASLFVDKE